MATTWMTAAAGRMSWLGRQGRRGRQERTRAPGYILVIYWFWGKRTYYNQYQLIDRWVLVFLGVGVPQRQRKKLVPRIVPPIVPKPPQKIMFFAEVSALSEILFEVLLNSTLNSTTKSL
jgi:hypothetical protein